MRKLIILLGLLPVLAVFNYAIYDKEKLLDEAELVLLPLAPVDPRSLMQGDYMRLRYQASVDAASWLKQDRQAFGEGWKAPVSNFLVVALDDKQRARFVRFHSSDKKLSSNERLLSVGYQKGWRRWDVKIHPDSFFFQEGFADAFEAAKFGMMRLRRDGDHLLVGLADEAGMQINPEP